MNFVQGILTDENGLWSSARFLNILAALVASFVMIWLTVNDKMTEGFFGLFLGGYVTNYLIGKNLDKSPATSTHTITSTTPPANVVVESTTEVKP